MVVHDFFCEACKAEREDVVIRTSTRTCTHDIWQLGGNTRFAIVCVVLPGTPRTLNAILGCVGFDP
jgi:hypothetical protein